jgi:glycosyltransferase involved in cell wall biosynthesis
MRMAFVTVEDARNVRSWSGIPYYMAQAFERNGISVEYVGRLRNPLEQPLRAKTLVYRGLRRKRYLRSRNPMVLRNYARQAARRIRQIRPDIVVSPGTIPIAFLECDAPIVFWSDATFGGMVNFYPGFTNLCAESLRQGHLTERSALEAASLAVYSSEWAAQTSRQHYHTDSERLDVVPFGANVEDPPDSMAVREMVNSRSRQICQLLFLGVDWHRKGGDIALRVAGELNRAGLPTELTIVGCDPPKPRELPSNIKRLGFLSKSRSEERSMIRSLLAQSHFLIAPSRAECYGIALAEANAFGVPCLTTSVGGTPTIIRNGRNGHLFPAAADASQYCAYVLDLFAHHSAYGQLALSSHDEFASRLNWAVATTQLKHRFLDLAH